MLPAPVSLSFTSRPRRPRKPSYTNGEHSYASLRLSDFWTQRLRLRILFARSRVTNLGILLLSLWLGFSLLLNLRNYFGAGFSTSFEETQGGGGRGRAKSIEDTIERGSRLRELDHLVIVPGHGVWLGNKPEEVWSEEYWTFEKYQSVNASKRAARARIGAFVAHIRAGVELADGDERSLLVFSGGATRPSTPFSESTSYFSVAFSLSLLSPPSPPPSYAHPHAPNSLTTYERTTTEDHALDSYQNLLFSLARFRVVTGHYPTRITIVGYAFKERRFSELHRGAVRWSAERERWRYVGIDFDSDSDSDGGEKEREEAIKGERLNGYLPYLDDLYGCHGTLLAKRRARNVHHKSHPYHISAPEIAPLLEWCPDIDSVKEGEDKEEEKETGAERWKFAPDPDLDYRKKVKDEKRKGVFKGPLPWDGL